MIAESIAAVVTWYMANINYGTVTLLMAIESSFIPFPSEIVVPPAAWKAAQGELNVVGVFVAATLGAMIGAVVNYFLALFLGRPVLYRLADTRWAHLLLIRREGLEKTEAYFVKYGKSSTFIGRLVPAVRQLISLPAGVSRMNLAAFLGFTALGAGIWNAILAALGYFLYSQKDLLHRYYKLISYGGLVVGMAFAVYIVVKVMPAWNKSRGAS
ncbi:MAG: DedA family protein [Chitinivibrionales bacterium]|nr:DedA family protein [Chitinivibrionales bacterium]MBD3396143.1 DedA family protein [Chitinivibrionales bacterium]